MVLIGAAILPHASMILDPTMDDIPTGVDELHSACKYVGDYVRDHEPVRPKFILSKSSPAQAVSHDW